MRQVAPYLIPTAHQARIPPWWLILPVTVWFILISTLPISRSRWSFRPRSTQVWFPVRSPIWPLPTCGLQCRGIYSLVSVTTPSLRAAPGRCQLGRSSKPFSTTGKIPRCRTNSIKTEDQIDRWQTSRVCRASTNSNYILHGCSRTTSSVTLREDSHGALELTMRT